MMETDPEIKASQSKANANGFSIIETLIAMAILSIVSFGFMGWVDMSYKNLGNVNENNDIANAMGRLRAAFGDDDVPCTAMLGQKSIGGAIPFIPYYDFKNGAYNNPGDYKHHVLDTNSPEGLNGKPTVQVASINLVQVSDLGPFNTGPSAPPEPRTVIANLVVNFKKTNNSGPDIVRKLPLYTLVAGGKIVRCSANAMSGAESDKRFCDIHLDGFGYIDYSKPPGQRCVNLPNTHWVNGASSKTASCPAGEIATEMLPPAPKMLHGGLGNLACEVDTMKGSYVPPRTYTGYGTVSDNSYPAKGTLNGSTCTFAYDASIDSSSFKPRIHCLKP